MQGGRIHDAFCQGPAAAQPRRPAGRGDARPWGHAVLKRSLRPLWAAAAVLAAGAAAAPAAWPHPPDDAKRAWVATWSAPPMAPGSAFAAPRAFENQTVRHIVHVHPPVLEQAVLAE